MIDWTILIILVGLEIAKMRFGPQGNKAAKVVVRDLDLIIQNPKLYKLHMTLFTLFTWVLSHFSKYEITSPPYPTRQVYSYFSWLGVSHMPVSIFTWYDPSK